MLYEISPIIALSSALPIRGVHISMGKFQSGFLKKHIAVPGCILLPENKYVRVEHFDPGKWEFWIFSVSMGISMGKWPKI